MTALWSTTPERAAEGLTGLFAARGIAVVGASSDPRKLGAVMARSLDRFPGPVALVNATRFGDGPIRCRRGRRVRAHRPRRAVRAGRRLPRPRSRTRPRAACGPRWCAAAGSARPVRRVNATRPRSPRSPGRTGIRLLGPNTSGFLAPQRGLTASFVPGAAAVPAGAGRGRRGQRRGQPRAGVPAGRGRARGQPRRRARATPSTSPPRTSSTTSPATRRTTAVALHVESVADGPRLLAAVAR